MAQLLTLRVTTLPLPLKSSAKSSKMSIHLNTNTTPIRAAATATVTEHNSNRKLPILLFDIMDTIVRDPFYHDVPAFFRMSFKELMECKNPTAWIEFENGLINEAELERKFFKDGRSFDLEGLKNCMSRGYSYVDGFEPLLQTLKHNNYEMHAFTNYPIWYRLIEDKLNISTYLSWTFCSCIYGKRKPDPDFFLEVLNDLKVDPANCIFIDDRIGNVDVAKQVGIVGLQFKNVDSLREDLLSTGVNISNKTKISDLKLGKN